MVRRSGLVLAFSAAWAFGCQPKIGDECVGSVDCSQQGDRLCDTSQPDGYCTAFNCQPDGCPEEAVCIGFGLELDPSCSAETYDPRWPRFERTFCMLGCEQDSDCREGYVCIHPSDRRAVSVDVTNELRDSGVCFVASGAVFEPNGEVPDSCTLPQSVDDGSGLPGR